MTVPNTNYQTSFTGDGATTAFSFPWTITDPSQVQVYIGGVLVNSGVTVTENLVTNGGTVTFTTPPVNNAVGLITRETDYLQLDTLLDNAPLPATTITSMFDKLTIMVQQIANLISSCLQFPLSSGVSGTLPAPVGGAIVAVNAAANGAAYIQPVASGLALLDNGPGNLPSFGPVASAAGGNVIGPASAGSGNVAAFSGTGGKVLEDSGIPFSALLTSTALSPSIGGRLTLTTGTPVADATSAGTLYWTPFKGNLAWLKYNGTWTPYNLAEISLALTLTSGDNYAVYLKATSASAAQLVLQQWTNSTTRATALVVDSTTGLLVKSGDASSLYVGDIYASGTNACTDNAGLRGVYNYYNRVARALYAQIPTTSWNYSTATWRASDANTTPGQGCVAIMSGMGDTPASVSFAGSSNGNSTSATIANAIGVNSTTAPLNGYYVVTFTVNGSNIKPFSAAPLLPVGFNTIQMLEYVAAGSPSFYGNESTITTGGPSQMTGVVTQ